MKPPNLFDYATSELSQDALLAWLIAHAAPQQAGTILHSVATDFLRLIYTKCQQPFPIIERLEIQQQTQFIDVLVKINDTDAIIIEDKTNTKAHSDQLRRYLESIKNQYQSILCLYYRTALQSQTDDNTIRANAFIPMNHLEMLVFLKQHINVVMTSEVLSMYHRHLRRMRDKYNAWQNREGWKNNSFAIVGFFAALEQAGLERVSNWTFSSNPRGGMHVLYSIAKQFDWASVYWQLDYEHLLQSEQQPVLFTARLGTNTQFTANERIIWLERFQRAGEKHNMPMVKPARFGSGDTMRVALHTTDMRVFQGDQLDLPATLERIRQGIRVFETATNELPT